MAISADLKIEISKNISIFCFLKGADNSQLIQSLQNGNKSEMTVQIRLYKKRKRPFYLFGDKLVNEFELIKISEKDLFSNSYIIKEKEQKTYYESVESLLDNYFHNAIELSSNNLVIDEASAYYVKVKATLVNRLYVEPFHIFNLLNYRESSTTGWIVSNLIQDRE